MGITMNRRLMMAALACSPTAPLSAQDETSRPRHKISAGELHEALSARFPVRFGVPGLVELQVSAPRLLLLSTRNQLGATLLAQVGGRELQQIHAGEVDVVFAVRYAASDQTLRAHHPEILGLRWPGLPPETRQTLQRLLPALAREAVGELVLHKFSSRELALADTMGFEPETIAVLDDGLLIVFGPKRRP